jgi:hypothetical protein
VLPSFQEYGEALEIVTSSGMTALTVDGLTSIMQGIVFGGHNHLYVVYINVAGSTPLVTLKNLDLAVQDSRETGYLELTGIDLEGNMLLNLDSAALNVDIANMTRWGTKGIDLGGQSANINGTISRFRIVQIVTDPSPRGIVVHGTATLTIPTMLTIRECDFTAMTGGTAILFDSGNQNKDKVYLYNNRP